MNRYYVYIMTNRSRTLYVGVTNDLERRVAQHRSRQAPGITAKYNCTMLAYYEEFTNVNEAIAWEKRIKGWLRARKIALIESQNPRWKDLAAEWYASSAPVIQNAAPVILSAAKNLHRSETKDPSPRCPDNVQ